MKASTPELMKFKKLQRRLNEPRRGIIGLLEGLWIETARNCPQGDIGKFTNEEIAIMCDWEDDPNELISALVDCGWLDQCEIHRLVVHDWSDHCPKYVKGNVMRHTDGFAVNRITIVPKELRKEPPITTPEQEPRSLPNEPRSKPIQAKSIQAKPSQTISDFVVVDETWTVSAGEVTSEITPKEPGPTPRAVFEAWNSRAAVVAGVQRVRDLNRDRLSKLATRLKNPHWPWQAAIARLPLPGDPSGWQPSFDWLIRNGTNAERIVDGEFEFRKSMGNRAPPSAIGPGQKFDPTATGVGF